MNADYVWEESYKTAILETDDSKLPNRLQAAKGAIDTRLQEMQMDHGGTPEEHQVITDALAGLNVLRRELEKRSQDTGFEQIVNLANG
jgi:hypothetical protein